MLFFYHELAVPGSICRQQDSRIPADDRKSIPHRGLRSCTSQPPSASGGHLQGETERRIARHDEAWVASSREQGPPPVLRIRREDCRFSQEEDIGEGRDHCPLVRNDAQLITEPTPAERY